MTGEHRSFLGRYWMAIVAVALVTLLAVALFSRPAPSPPPDPTAEAFPITTSGDARDVALSPDGSHLAYLTGGGTALAVRPLPDGPVVEVTRGAVPLGPPRWHPDGSVLLYACPPPRALCGIPAAGGEADTVAILPDIGVTAYGFAPDGTYVVATAAGPWIYRGARASSLTLVGNDSVTADGRLSDLRGAAEWVVGVAAAPDGADVAYRAIRVDGRGVIARVVSGAARHRTLVDDLREGYNLGSATSGHLVWGADGFIYFSRRVAGRRAIARIPADIRGGEPTDLLDNLPENLSFDLSRDGAAVAYAGGASRRRLYLFPVGERARVVPFGTRDPTWSYGSPAISPGGEVAAYVGTGPTGESDVYLRPLGGGPERQLTFDRRPKRGLAWSPDGERLAFLSETGRGPWLMTVDTAFGRLQRLGDAPAHPYGQPAWSPDARYVLYPILEGGLVLVEAAQDGRVASLGAPGGSALHAIFAPDGLRVAVALGEPDRRGIWLIELGGGPATRLTTGPDRPLRWTVSGELYFVRQDGPYRGSEVLRQRASAGSVAHRWHLPLPCDAAEVVLSRDARSVICSVDEFASDAWLQDAPDPR